MNDLLGTEIGTSGTKTVLMDTEGHLIAQDLQEYDIITPRPLWAEQWPDVWLDATKASIRNTGQKSGISKEKDCRDCN
ncbi:FGGY family carbohydrate kinase [Heyndrickxia coagulans]|uniref:FGGY family carbohydrate kinase n=1 Tax=Heyndrickxia coagulans TaxID=1398 RepID=UPI002236AB46|nr:FGGY family carbohydrate kinase [Heyndrickxia coagulans]UZH07895.1 FGGY family carbohydrate kinase [Heyndrickxia coagulans]